MNIQRVYISLSHNNQIVVRFENMDLEMEARNNGNTVMVDHLIIECDALTYTQCTIANTNET